MNSDIADFKAVVRRFARSGPHPDQHFEAASVFLLLYGERTPCLLAVLKADSPEYPWRNQVALPGGHVDAQTDASALDAAFRELNEELGIGPEQVCFIGSLGHFQTILHKDIQVFIGLWNQEGPLKPDPQEISRVLKIPLTRLAECHSGQNDKNPVYPLDHTIAIWGVTAKILYHFFETAYPRIAEKWPALMAGMRAGHCD